jgi:hypothetical protein
VERLDELLLRIIEEPSHRAMSRNEIEFWEKMRDLRRKGNREYASYAQAYKDIHQAKLDDEKF